jgi:hypothetical protein
MAAVRHFVLAFLLCSVASAQDIYHDCPMGGTAKRNTVQNLNRQKNRYNEPRPEDFDSKITLKDMLAPGYDVARFDHSKAVTITGYVEDVKMGGVETCNCGTKDPQYRDTHIELVLDPMKSGETQRVIVEVTPRWRAIMQAKGIDWSTKALRTKFMGRWVKVNGWLMFDAEHENASENTNPGRARNWRATAWEVHPITSIEVNR